MSGLTFPGRGGLARKRRGRVGAGLPAEPWDLPDAEGEATINAEEGDEDAKEPLDENQADEDDEGVILDGDERREMRRARSKTMGEVSSTPFPSEYIRRRSIA